MESIPAGRKFYADWRLHCGAANVLRDENDSPPERLLQAVWQHQRLRREELMTADEKAVRVLHPGFASAEGGLDFRGAVIQIGDNAPRSGDVEVDVRASGWHGHGHDRNSNFQGVILHVVWRDAGVHASACSDSRVSNKQKFALQPSPPTLVISDKLDAPLAELGLWLETDSPHALPENLRGRCAPTLRELNGPQATELLRAAEGKNQKLQRMIEHRYFAWLPAGDNSVLILARQRLLGGSPGRVLQSAAGNRV